MEIPQNTINMGLMAPAAGRFFRIWRANVSRLVAEPGMGLVLVVGGVMLSSPGPASIGPSGFGLGSPWSESSCAHQGSLEDLARKHWCGHHLYRSFQARVWWELLSCTWVSNPEHTSTSSSCLFSRNNVLISSIATAREKKHLIWLQVLLLDPS